MSDELLRKGVKYVDVTINPIASIESKDLIKQLSSAARKKLIFLLPQDIMTDNDEMMGNEIKLSHETFYDKTASA